jgi:vancomycin resistance protein VanJ
MATSPTGAARREAELSRPRGRGRARVGRRSRWPWRLAALYLVAVVAAGTVARGLAERTWWSTLLLYAPQVLYLAPAPPLLLLAAWRRDGRALLLLLAAAGFVGGPLMGYNLPGGGAFANPEALAGRPRVRVLTYNIRGAAEGFAPISREVRRLRPDVVVFTEAWGWGREARLARELAAEFRGWHSVQGGDVYLASRWPLRERRAELMGVESATHATSGRRKVRARVAAPFAEFDVVGAHFYTAMHGESLLDQRHRLPEYLAAAARVRRDQARDVVRWATAPGRPAIVAGDFNTPPAGLVYGELTGSFRDAFAEAGLGWGYTYPSRLPVVRIDYVLHSGEWRTVTARVGAGDGSDHLAVFAELAYVGRGQDMAWER